MAVAIPGRPGHLLVTTAILRLLDPDEQRVMFAHERAHLRHVGNRELTARAVARAALATVRPEPLLGIDGGIAVRRVRALADPAPEPGRRRLLAILILITAFAATAASATVEFANLARAWL